MDVYLIGVIVFALVGIWADMPQKENITTSLLWPIVLVAGLLLEVINWGE